MHVTTKYKKKVRLLVTNQCSRNCKYCHNEGMEKQPVKHLSPKALEPFLPEIKVYTNRIVLSGGEPFEYTFLEELIDLLEQFGFDTSLISANIRETQLYSFGHKLKGLHYSVHSVQNIHADALIIRRINHNLPNIKLSINIPFSEISPIAQKWTEIYDLALEVGANIQLIKLFTPGSTLLSSTQWEDRWGDMQRFLEPLADFLEATERETRYITKDSIKIDLLDIPCRASGTEFLDGACLNNSDITVDPNLCVSICRWGDNSVPLVKEGIRRSFHEAVLEATKKSCRNCSYGALKNYVRNQETDYYLNIPHYTWPKATIRFNEYLSMASSRDLSYYGRSGNIARLESCFCKFLGCNYALAINSGTAAVYLAILALDLAAPDEIVMPVATFPSLVGAANLAGVNVRLCDIDPLTGNISPESFRKVINQNVKAVLVTHLWGQPADLAAITEICSENKIFMIEDCSHAYGAEYEGEKVGTFGDIACFSMQANKAVFAGEGGIFATNNRKLYETAVLLSSSVERILDCVKTPEALAYWGTGLGVKLKMNPLGAIVALRSLNELAQTNEARAMRLSLITDAAKRTGIFDVADEQLLYIRRVYYTYKLALKEPFIVERNNILRAFIHAGLEAGETSFIPVYKHELSKRPFVLNGKDSFPNAEMYYKRIISLPAFVYEPYCLVKQYADNIQKIGEIVYAKRMNIERGQYFNEHRTVNIF